MARENSSGRTESSTREILTTIESPAEVFIGGLIAVIMKDKSKMVSDMASANTQLTKLRMKASGLRAKSKAQVRLFSRAAVSFKATLKMIRNRAMAKCITILLATILKANGKSI